MSSPLDRRSQSAAQLPRANAWQKAAVGIAIVAATAAIISAVFAGLNYNLTKQSRSELEAVRLLEDIRREEERRQKLVTDLMGDWWMDEGAKRTPMGTAEERRRAAEPYINNRLRQAGEKWRYDGNARRAVDDP